MRKLALLGAVAVLWLFVAALPAFADGGPHTMVTNNGTAGLTADSCAGCHRAHTATAASLLSTEQPQLCLNCHDGSKATTDVVDGVQFAAATGATPNHANTSTIVGALRGGGFQYALIQTSTAAKISVSSAAHTYNAHVSPLGSTASVGQPVTSTHGGTGGIYNTGWGEGTVWGSGAVSSTAKTYGATVVLECASCHNPHGNGQYRILQTVPSLISTPTGGFTATIGGKGVQVVDTTTTGLHNYTIKPASDGWNASGSVTGVDTTKQGDYWRYRWDATGAIPWTTVPNAPDPMNTGWSGQGATNSAGLTVTVAAGTYLTADLLATGGSTITVSNTVTWPTPGFILVVDSEKMLVTGLTAGTGSTPTSLAVRRGYLGTAKAPHTAATALVSTEAWGVDQNATGLMTAWCLQCHTRYNGFMTTGGTATTPGAISTAASGTDASSLVLNSADAVFMYKHGTTRVGCEQCHVSHGSNALMTGDNSLNFKDPAGATVPTVNVGGTPAVISGDSRLLKADNRGTCQLCHDPTSTLADGTVITWDSGSSTWYSGPLSGAPAGSVPGN